MKIYTKIGDRGETRLYNRHVLSKTDHRVYCLGAVDSLNAQVGLLATQARQERKLVDILDQLLWIQEHLFDITKDLATLYEDRPYELKKRLATQLEVWIDDLNAETEKSTRFLLPGGHLIAAQAHICRTQTRQTELHLWQLKGQTEDLNSEIFPFMNRLSDYFFALARAINQRYELEENQYTRSPQVFGS